MFQCRQFSTILQQGALKEKWLSSGSSGWVSGGRETWNLCGRLRWPSFLWLIFTGPGGHGPLGPPGSATGIKCLFNTSDLTQIQPSEQRSGLKLSVLAQWISLYLVRVKLPFKSLWAAGLWNMAKCKFLSTRFTVNFPGFICSLSLNSVFFV